MSAINDDGMDDTRRTTLTSEGHEIQYDPGRKSDDERRSHDASPRVDEDHSPFEFLETKPALEAFRSLLWTSGLVHVPPVGSRLKTPRSLLAPSTGRARQRDDDCFGDPPTFLADL